MTSRTSQRKRKAAAASKRRSPKGKQKRSRGGSRLGFFAVFAVGVVVLAMVGLSVYNHVKTPPTPGASARDRVVRAVTSVPAAALDAVGAGSGVSQPSVLPAGTPPLTQSGKPEILYIGAEYCPFCAAERWPMAIALSRFGTFSGVGLTTSSSTDVYPSTPTLTFHGSTYTSDLISFAPIETETNQLSATGLGYRSLDAPSAPEQQLMQTYDSPPYVTSAGSIPFILLGNRYVISGSSYRPDVLQHKTWQQVASALSGPSSPIAEQVLGTANMLTAAICQLTGGQPSNVCTSSGVSVAASALPAP